MESPSVSPSASSAALSELAEEAWSLEQRRDAGAAMRSGKVTERLPIGSLAEAEALASQAVGLKSRVSAIPDEGLSQTDRVTRGFLLWSSERLIDGPRHWRESFGLTPYMSMGLGSAPRSVLAPFEFASPDDGARYLSLLGDYASLLSAHLDRLKVQAEAGWRIPRPALANTRLGLVNQKAALCALMRPTPERLVTAGGAGLLERIERMIDGEIVPGFERLIEALGPDYEAAAGEAVGMQHLPGGVEAYQRLMDYHLSYRATPDRIHAYGRAEVEQLTEAMAALRARMGGAADEATFHDALRANPRAYAATPEALEAIYRRHMARIVDHLPTYFSVRPKADCDVERLAPEVEASMSFGFFQPPANPGDRGIYFYNGAKLDERMQLNAAPLIFHELAPGHHFHLALQKENTALPTIRREELGLTAYLEGWAEYAASLADEFGLYDDPYDAYGYLLQRRFAAQRMVVDTGMNALGWTLEEGRAYMRANTIEAEPFVESETLRYSTDLPAQALTYGVGRMEFIELRRRTEERLGARFDIRAYHAAVLEEGAMPLSLLQDHIGRWADRQAEA